MLNRYPGVTGCGYTGSAAIYTVKYSPYIEFKEQWLYSIIAYVAGNSYGQLIFILTPICTYIDINHFAALI